VARSARKSSRQNRQSPRERQPCNCKHCNYDRRASFIAKAERKSNEAGHPPVGGYSLEGVRPMSAALAFLGALRCGRPGAA
jgi:hypothetical protein